MLGRISTNDIPIRPGLKTGERMNLPTTKRARQKAATRIAVLRAAREEFHRQGYDRAKIVDIACAANVSPGTVLNAAPTKIALLCEVMVDDFERLRVESAELARRCDGDVVTCVTAVLDYHLDRHVNDLELFRAAIGHNWLTNEADFKALHIGLESAWSPVRDVLTRAAHDPAVDLHECPDLLTESLLDLYLGVLRRCVIYKLSPQEARSQMHRRLSVVFHSETMSGRAPKKYGRHEGASAAQGRAG